MTATEYIRQTPPFRKGGDNVLIGELNERQRRHDYARAEDGEHSPRAISSSEVIDALHELGMVAGYDGAATELFFGTDGREGYSDGDERFAIDTHGGFVFADPEEGDLYTITATRSSGWSVTPARRREIPRRSDNPSHLEELRRSLKRSLANTLPGGSGAGQKRTGCPSGLRWAVAARAMCYEVQPRFYEDMNTFDLLPFGEHVGDPADAGLFSLYPPQMRGSIRMGSGAITAGSAEEAITLAEDFGAVMASHGVLCDPRVVLMETHDLPLLPHQARNEQLYESRRPAAEADDDEDMDMLAYGAFLGEPHGLLMDRDHGHHVRKRRSALVPEQSKAGWLACRASEYSAYEDRVRDLQARLEDPAIPELRKETLKHHLGRDAAIRDQAREALADESDSLAGLLLSLIDERRELARDAALRRMGM